MAKKPIEYVTIEVDGKELSVRKDRYLLWSLRDAYYDVPYFCAHKWLDPPFSGCRQCMVQIEVGGKMMPKLQTSCSMLPTEGMRVITQSSEVLQARKEQLEFHLLNHPLECPTCDKGGECMLQDQTMDHGLSTGRYIEEKRLRPDAVMNDYILMNYKRCIHCKRCIHYGESIDGSHLLKFIDRGASTWIESFPTPGEAPRFTGNVIDMCPVGALTARSYRFMGRPWEQEPSASVGSLDSVGANIWLCARLGEMARIIPRDNDDVDFGLIDDVTRFHWECVDDPRRISKTIIRNVDGQRELSLGAGAAEAARLLAGIVGEHGPDSIGVIGGSGLNTEELFALRKFCTRDLSTANYHFGEDLFGPAGLTPGVQHSLWHDKGSIDQIANAATVLSIGCDMFEEAPSLGLRVDIQARRGLTKLLSTRSHRSDADRFAAVFSTYGYGNILRTVRALTNGLSGKGETVEEIAGVVDALKSIGDDCAIVYGSEVWRHANPGELVEALAALRAAIDAANPGNKGVTLNPVYPAVNSVGALLVSNAEKFGGNTDGKPSVGTTRKVLEAAASGKLRALVIADYDLLSLYPDRDLVERALRGAINVVYIGPFHNATSERAGLHLPLGTYAHKDGTAVSLEWRVQRRTNATLVNTAPDLLNVLNTIAAEMGNDEVSPNTTEINAELRAALPCYAQDALAQFPHTGAFVNLAQAGQAATNSSTDLPGELKTNPEYPLVVVPKRFLYNDREEIRYSPVFDRVPKPFFAYLNPTDMKVQNLNAGDMVELQTGTLAAQLPISPASWVRQGSVVVNDHHLAVPANGIAGVEPTRVKIERIRGGAQAPTAAEMPPPQEASAEAAT